jgi:arsenate reductase
MKKPLVLSYSGCSTCAKALRWLKEHGVEATVRPIVEQPPTPKELAAWVKASGLPVKKWLNTSGLSYRAFDAEQKAAADDATWLEWLAADGKLVKRPVLVLGERVLVGFDADKYAELF